MADKSNKDSKICASEAATMPSTHNCHLESSRADRRVWLMKCPPVVARAMQSANHPPPPYSSDASAGPIVAKVVVVVDPLRLNDDLSSTQFTMELAGPRDSNMPTLFSMDMSTDFVPMAVLAESSQGKPSVEGKIYHKIDMKPREIDMPTYSKLCRERTNKSMTRTRRVQVIENDNGMRMRPMPGTFDIKSSGSMDKKVQAKGSEAKRTRRDREEMEKIMFKLFERQPNWTLKQLILKTNQPEQYLKDMLKTLCVYNNKGANQGSYELKPEYRRSEDKSDSD